MAARIFVHPASLNGVFAEKMFARVGEAFTDAATLRGITTPKGHVELCRFVCKLDDEMHYQRMDGTLFVKLIPPLQVA